MHPILSSSPFLSFDSVNADISVEISQIRAHGVSIRTQESPCVDKHGGVGVKIKATPKNLKRKSQNHGDLEIESKPYPLPRVSPAAESSTHHVCPFTVIHVTIWHVSSSTGFHAHWYFVRIWIVLSHSELRDGWRGRLGAPKMRELSCRSWDAAATFLPFICWINLFSF